MSGLYYEKPPNPTGVEMSGGGTANDEVSVPFLVFGALTEVDCDAAVRTGSVSNRFGMVRADWTMEEIAPSTWQGKIRYVMPSTVPPVPPPEPGDDEFEFDTTGISTKKTYGQEIAVFTPDGGDDGITFGGAINVKQDKNGADVEGVDVGVRAFSFSVTLYIPDDEVTEDFIRALYMQSWTVNDAAVTMYVQGKQLTFQAGELLFKGAVGRKRRSVGDWPIQYQFAASPNMENLPIGPVGAPVLIVDAKDGWDYLWVQFADDATSKSIIKKPKCAVVDRVYDRTDFTNFGIPQATLEYATTMTVSGPATGTVGLASALTLTANGRMIGGAIVLYSGDGAFDQQIIPVTNNALTWTVQFTPSAAGSASVSISAQRGKVALQTSGSPLTMTVVIP